MVYQDLSDKKSPNSQHFQIAPLADRLLAFVFDLVIFTPVFSFIMAGMFKHVELMYFTSPQSMEFMILILVSVLFGLILAILFQTLFLIWMGATPGKYFFKIRVVSVSEPTKRLRFSQAFLRSSLWAFEFLCFGLPWLEVLSEGKRRPLHDRAAGTMTSTRKVQGDQGPHILETQFVRQLLVATSLLVLTWAIFAGGHFYKMAVHGGFKKTELEAEEYLCSSVTQSLESHDVRIDKALALYLADEITEECLSSEADFVLWTPSDLEKSWAYLAKGILKKYDSAQLEGYLQKTCDIDSEGIPCQLAQHEADPRNFKIPEGSETSRILQVIEDFEKGKYAQAEKSFTNLGKVIGYETFAREGVVKSLWAQNKIERSKGAYANIVHQLMPPQKKELAAWICHEELDRQCGQEAIEACEDLKDEYRENKEPIKDSFVALALIREKECRHSTAVEYFQFQELFQEKKDILLFVQTLIDSAKVTEEQKKNILLNLSFRKEPVRPQFLRLLAIQALAETSQRKEHHQSLVTFLKEKKVKDLSWVKIYQKTLHRLISDQSELIKEIVDLPSSEMIARYNLEEDQVRGQYLAKNFEKAHQLLMTMKKPSDSSRSPASADGLSWKQIESDLRKKFSNSEERL